VGPRSNDVANACKQNAHGIGKAQSGNCWARKKGTAGRGMVRASKEAHVHTKCVVDVGFWLRLCWCRLCVEHAYTVPIAKNAQEGLCLDDPGCGLSAQFGSILVQ